MALQFAKKMSEMVPPFSLRRMLHERLEYHDDHRGVYPVHASDLTYQDKLFCAREFAITFLLGEKVAGKFVSTSLAYTFGLGRMIETGVREWFGDSAYGFWKCNRCGRETAFIKRPTGCGACGHNSWSYIEPVVTGFGGGLTGGIDLLVRPDGHAKLVLVEIKSIDKDYFKNLKAAMAEHRLRTNLYLDLVAKSGEPWTEFVDTSRGVVLYAMKGYGMKDETLPLTGYKGQAMTPFKEYIIKHDEEALEPVYDMARAAIGSMQGTAPIPEGICPTAVCTRAKKCAVAKQCFSGKYRAGEYAES